MDLRKSLRKREAPVEDQKAVNEKQLQLADEKLKKVRSVCAVPVNILSQI